MPVSDANPFFQEFEATFETHGVGMRIRKTHNLPVVYELLRTPSGEMSPAALAGVPQAAVLVGVAGERTLRLGHEEAIGRISGRGRPITLAFRRLHAAIDPLEARRYWQGYLRLKTGNSVWTGQFYVLREDGTLCCFPSKDIQGQAPVKVMRVGSDCAVIHGETLRTFLAGNAGASGASSPPGVGLSGFGGGGAGLNEGGIGGGTAGSGPPWWLECFAILAPDESIQVLRAPTPSARLDWVSALAVLSAVHGLRLWKLPPTTTPPATFIDSTDGRHSGSASRARGASHDSSEGGIVGGFGVTIDSLRRSLGLGVSNSGKRRADEAKKRQQRREEDLNDAEEEHGWGGRTEAVGVSGVESGTGAGEGGSVARVVLQGFLKKKMAGRLWTAWEDWEYRWVVLREDGRLAWYLSVPSDPLEVPNGYLFLYGARISCSEGAVSRNSLREDEVRGEDLSSFTIDVDGSQHGIGYSGSGGDIPRRGGASVRGREVRQRRGRPQGLPPPSPRQGTEPRWHWQEDSDREREKERWPSTLMQQQQDRRVVVLSACGEQERAAWVNALHRFSREDGRRLMDLGREIRHMARKRRKRGLDRLLEDPEELLARPHEAFALLVGNRDGGGRGLTRAEFCECTGQHLLPMCDVYTAGAVFDSLCPKRVDVPEKPGPSIEGAQEELLDLVGEGTETGGADGVRTGRISAEAIAGQGISERLTFDVFRRYAEALYRTFRPSEAHPSWEDLRLRLDLHPLEVLLMGEEFVTEAGDSSPQLDLNLTSLGWPGTLFLTDRHLLLHLPNRQQVRVVPLGSVKGVRASSSRAGPFTMDDTIEIVGCEVHTVPLGFSREEAAGKETAVAAAAAAAAAATVAAAEHAPAASTTEETTAATTAAEAEATGVAVAGARAGTAPTAAEATDTNGKSGGVGRQPEQITGRQGSPKKNQANSGSEVGGGSGNGSAGVEPDSGSGVESDGGGGRRRPEPGRRSVYRLVLTKVKVQRLMSKTEDGGGTRQEWLDCLNEIVEAHRLSHGQLPTAPLAERRSAQGESAASSKHTPADEPDVAGSPTSTGCSPLARRSNHSLIGGSVFSPKDNVLCGNDGGGSGGRNAWGGRGLNVLGWGAKVRRLAMKVGALVRDRSPDSSRDAFEVEESRLRLWTAVNIMRSRALSRARTTGPGSGSGARPLLLLSRSSLPNRHQIVRAFLESATEISGSGGGGVDDGISAPRSGRHVSSGGGGGSQYAGSDGAAVGVRNRHHWQWGRWRRWLLILVRFTARPREFERRRAAAIRTFTPQKFRLEWELFWELLDPLFDDVGSTITDLLQWKRPRVSLAVMSGLLLVAQLDLVRYAIPLALLGNVAYIYAAYYLSREDPETSPAGNTKLRGGKHLTQASLDGSALRGRHRGSPASPRSKLCSTPSPRSSPSPVSNPPTAAVAAAAAAAAAAEFGRTIAAEFLLGGAGNLNARAYAAAKATLTDDNNEDTGAFLGCTREDKQIRGRTPPSSRTAAAQGPSGIGSGGIWGGGGETDVGGGHHAGGDNRTPVVFVPYDVAGVGDQTLAANATSLGSAASVVQQQHQQQPEGIFRRVKGMQDRAGQTQEKLHNYNAILLKVKSLHAWRYPERTRVWVVGVSLLAAFLALVPSRYTFAALVLFLFSEPIRSKKKMLPEILFRDFWSGLPMESVTHTNVRMAAIYSRHNHKSY